ncbi:MAG TPA: FGGY-family carbohydrate kinase [Candidatus Dormibacteraeota bacterium]|jgi:xylulokinase|nr:FGGY-family carbohydrate kinase [Candidatus Dormibacteraeota bacterium]
MAGVEAAFLGIDVGTASSKAVLVSDRGDVLASAQRPHGSASPRPNQFEHDAEAIWWGDVRALIAELGPAAGGARGICVSGIGPCALITDEEGDPLRPAILYGIDGRATEEIETLTAALGEEAIEERCGNRLTTQSVGPKLAWLERHEPEVRRRARRWHSCSSFVARRLTGRHVLDHYTASTAEPLYDVAAHTWWDRGWEAAAPGLTPPDLAWPGDVVGTVTARAAGETGLAEGIPVLAGSIDAVTEGDGVGVREPGDTVVMYGSTMFLIQVLDRRRRHPGLWANDGTRPGRFSLAAGMATSGLVTTWLAGIAGADVGDLVREAGSIPAGSEGLVLLPYFLGERTPLFDPEARGCWLGLTIHHTRAHLYRSVLEGVAYGVRHNLEAMAEAGPPSRRLVAVGGGTRGDLWTQIVSDVVGLPQEVRAVTIGAAYGDARLVAEALGVDTAAWNPIVHLVRPDAANRERYEERYQAYRRLYPLLAEEMHRLSRS